MKTLDEVIKALGICDETVTANCPDCPYDLDCENVPGEDLRADALHYLKEFKELSKMWNDRLDKENSNPPLTWNELRAMAGKPVWLVHEGTGESSWVFVGEWFDDDEMRVCRMLRDYADYITKEIYENGTWRAYRKERE